MGKIRWPHFREMMYNLRPQDKVESHVSALLLFLHVRGLRGEQVHRLKVQEIQRLGRLGRREG